MGLFDNKEKRFAEAAPVKDRLLEDVANAVKQVQAAYLDRESGESKAGGKVDLTLERFCQTLDAVFTYALRDPSTTFWPYVKTITRKDAIDAICNPRAMVKTDRGRARSWVRLAISEQGMESYFFIIQADTDKIKQDIYRTHSLVFDVDRLGTLAVHVAAVESLSLKLPPSSSNLDLEDYGIREEIGWQNTPTVVTGSSSSNRGGSSKKATPQAIIDSNAVKEVVPVTASLSSRSAIGDAPIATTSTVPAAAIPIAVPRQSSRVGTLTRADLEDSVNTDCSPATEPLVFVHQARVKKVKTTEPKKKKKIKKKIINLDGQDEAGTVSAQPNADGAGQDEDDQGNEAEQPSSLPGSTKSSPPPVRIAPTNIQTTIITSPPTARADTVKSPVTVQAAEAAAPAAPVGKYGDIYSKYAAPDPVAPVVLATPVKISEKKVSYKQPKSSPAPVYQDPAESGVYWGLPSTPEKPIDIDIAPMVPLETVPERMEPVMPVPLESAVAASTLAAAAASVPAPTPVTVAAVAPREPSPVPVVEPEVVEPPKPKRPLDPIGSTVTIDNHLQLKLLLEVFRHDSEKIVLCERMRWVERTAKTAGVQHAVEHTSFFVLTNRAVYLVPSLPSSQEEKLRTEISGDLRQLKDIRVTQRGQMIVLRFPRDEITLMTRDELSTEILLKQISTACQSVGMVVIPIDRHDANNASSVESLLNTNENSTSYVMRHLSMCRARRVVGDKSRFFLETNESSHLNHGRYVASTADESLQALFARVVVGETPYSLYYTSRRISKTGQLRYKPSVFGRGNWQTGTLFVIQGAELLRYKTAADAEPVESLALRSTSFNLSRIKDADFPLAFEVRNDSQCMVLAPETEREARAWITAIIHAHCEPFDRLGRSIVRQDVMNVNDIPNALCVLCNDALLVLRELLSDNFELVAAFPLSVVKVDLSGDFVNVSVPLINLACSGNISNDWAAQLSEMADKVRSLHPTDSIKPKYNSYLDFRFSGNQQTLVRSEKTIRALTGEFVLSTLVVTNDAIHVCEEGTVDRYLYRISEIRLETISKIVCDFEQLNTCTLVSDEMNESTNTPIQFCFASEEEMKAFIAVVGIVWKDIFFVDLTVLYVY